jgi:hypothetical protein
MKCELSANVETAVPSNNGDVLKDRLDALSRRIEARKRELEEQGAFSGIHTTGMDDFRKRAAWIKEKLETAISTGVSWDIVKYELERDWNSLYGDFEMFEERLDAEAAKRIGEARST